MAKQKGSLNNLKVRLQIDRTREDVQKERFCKDTQDAHGKYYRNFSSWCVELIEEALLHGNELLALKYIDKLEYLVKFDYRILKQTALENDLKYAADKLDNVYYELSILGRIVEDYPPSTNKHLKVKNNSLNRYFKSFYNEFIH